MKNATIARNYAEALLAAAAATQQVVLYGRLIDAVAGAVQAAERVAGVLESPRVAKGVKAKLLEEALAGSAPPEVVRVLQAGGGRGRQRGVGGVAPGDPRLPRVRRGPGP